MSGTSKIAVLPLPPSSRPLSREEGFTALYKENHEAVRSLLFRFRIAELEDLVQEVFLKAYRNREAFRAEASVKTWLIRIAINVAKDHLKNKHTRVKTEELDPERHGGTRTAMPLADIIEACMDQLTLPHREILVLCAIEGYTMKEAAEILDLPEGTVKSRLSAARQDMRDRLKVEGVSA